MIELDGLIITTEYILELENDFPVSGLKLKISH